ncbi:hypothetical protein [Granulicoccus sp. GXG6511]|uniref:hypothetical protein n=1 Tax=Granulicoccus sp. GXG6511 TaxID=3381351 RepID=UPI003D7F1849
MTSEALHIPRILRALCDDAAIFPPGLVPLADAVRAHRAHERSEHSALVGPLVLSVASLAALPALVADLGPGDLRVSLTVPGPGALAGALAKAAEIPAVTVVSVEVPLPPGSADVVASLAVIERAVGGEDGPVVYLEIPRDDRRPAALEALVGTRHRAKFRTGGTEAHLYPDAQELAAAIAACAVLNVPFKATAGLHHAIRNTDPETGFEQHGFLNLLLASHTAQCAADVAGLGRILEERDGAVIAAAIADLGEERVDRARAAFVSFGTCSIADPLTELQALGLLTREGSAR